MSKTTTATAEPVVAVNKTLESAEKRAGEAQEILADASKLARKLVASLPVAKLRAAERAYLAAHKEEIDKVATEAAAL